MLEVAVTSTELVEPTPEVLENVNVFFKIKQYKSFLKCKTSDMYKMKYHRLCGEYLFDVIDSNIFFILFSYTFKNIYVNSILICVSYTYL